MAPGGLSGGRLRGESGDMLGQVVEISLTWSKLRKFLGDVVCTSRRSKKFRIPIGHVHFEMLMKNGELCPGTSGGVCGHFSEMFKIYVNSSISHLEKKKLNEISGKSLSIE